MSETTQSAYHGACFCGAVEIVVSGQPQMMGYCHCDSCRAWSAAPVNAFTIWDPENVKIVKGEDQVETFNKTEVSHRRFCRQCGGHIMANHPTYGFVDVYAAIIPGLPFEPQMHINYGEKVLAIRDGLPKLTDLPSELGGSGETLRE